ncbi:hypothetical protein HPB47_012911, partial [Ixodes persulcatus]
MSSLQTRSGPALVDGERGAQGLAAQWIHMERLKTKRTTRRAQNTRLINEASALLQNQDSTISQITTVAERLRANNDELRRLNEEFEGHIPDATAMPGPNSQPDRSELDRLLDFLSIEVESREKSEFKTTETKNTKTTRYEDNIARRESSVRGVIDGGSQQTFVTEDLSRHLQLKCVGYTKMALSTFACASTQECKKRCVVELELRSQFNMDGCKAEAIE